VQSPFQLLVGCQGRCVEMMHGGSKTLLLYARMQWAWIIQAQTSNYHNLLGHTPSHGYPDLHDFI